MLDATKTPAALIPNVASCRGVRDADIVGVPLDEVFGEKSIFIEREPVLMINSGSRLRAVDGEISEESVLGMCPFTIPV